MAEGIQGVRRNAIPVQRGSLGVSAASPQLGITGGGSRVDSSYVGGGETFFRNGMDASFGEGMPEFVNELFRPNLEAAAEARRFEGFTAGMEGATQEQIRAEQPWYTRVFGPTDYEMGAERFETLKKVNDLQTQFVQMLPELQQLSPQEVGIRLNDVFQEQMTGSPFADAVMQKQLLGMAAPLMQLHGKHHEAWQQAKQRDMAITTAGSASTALQSVMSAAASLGKDQPFDEAATQSMSVARNQLIEALRPGALQPVEVTKEIFTTFARQAANNGEFYPLNFMIESGILSHLPEEDRVKLEEYVDKAESRAARRFVMEDDGMIERLAKYEARIASGEGGEPTLAEGRRINDYYTAKTGSRRPMLDDLKLASDSGRSTKAWLEDYRHEQNRADRIKERADTAAEKAKAEAFDAAQAVKAFTSGAGGRAERNGVPSDIVERGGLSAWRELMDGGRVDQAMGMLVYNSSTRDAKKYQGISDELQNNVRAVITPEYNGGIDSAFAQWQSLRNSKGIIRNPDTGEMEMSDASGGPAAAALYYGQYDALFQEYETKLRSQMPQEVAYRTTFGEAAQDRRIDLRGFDSKETKQNITEMQKAIADMDDNFLKVWFGNGHKLHPSFVAELAEIGGYDYGRLPVGLSPADRAKQAVNMRKMEGGVEIAGAYGWRNAPGQRTMAAYLNDPNGSVTGNLFMAEIEAKAKKIGADLSGSVLRTRTQDINGVPQIHVVVYDKDGVKPMLITGEDLRRRNNLMREQQATGVRERRTETVQRVWEQDLFNANDK